MSNSTSASSEVVHSHLFGPQKCALLDAQPWHPCPALGCHFLARHGASEAGYSLVVTDGVRGWIESRDTDYIVQQADVWAGCVEAAVQQLAELVLKDLCAALTSSDGGTTLTNGGSCGSHSSVAISWGDSSKSLTLSVNAFLEGLPYSWTFYLMALLPEAVSEMVVVPLAVQLQALKGQLQQQEQQLQQLRQKLSDLTPDGTRQHQATENETRISSLRSAAADVLTRGAAVVVAKHLAPDIYVAITTHKTGGAPSVSPSKAGGSTGRPPRARRQPGLAPRPRPAADLKAELLAEEHQQARRAQIEALTAPADQLATQQLVTGPSASHADQLASQAAGTPAVLPKPVKKKKKLNI